MSKYAQGTYQILNPEKYAGKKLPYYRSSWENSFCRFCDNNPAIIQWSSESIMIPYVNPFTGKKTIYIPDFFIVYMNKKGQRKGEVIEVKPFSQVAMENTKSMRDKASVALNTAKWTAARAWCKSQGVTFRIVTEFDIYHTGPKKKGPKKKR